MRNIFKWRRQILNMSQDELAKRAGVHQTNVSRLERGFDRHVPLEAQRRIARVLGVRLKDRVD